MSYIDTLIRKYGSIENAFHSECYTKHNIPILNQLLYQSKINIHTKGEYLFFKACSNGDYLLAKWLLEISMNKKLNLGMINIHFGNEEAFRNACIRGHLEVAKWLLDISMDKKLNLGVINIHAENEEAFRKVCEAGYYEIAKWLLYIGTKKELGNINVYIFDNFNKLQNNIKKLLLLYYSDERLINLNHPLANEELKRRYKVSLILFLFEKKYKLLDINAIAIIWKY